MLQVGCEDLTVVVDPSTAKHGPIPSKLMLAKRV
jgi:hypothetical protein